MSTRYTLGRECSECAKPIFDQSKSGRCKPCNMQVINRDPELRRKRGASASRILRENPYAYARKCAILAQNRAKALSRPEHMEMLRKNAPRLASYRTRETEAKRIAALIEANKRRRLAWLPEKYRDEYFRMIRHKQFKAPEAKEIILAQIAKDKSRAEATLSPFARQERALQRGANLVANDRGPVFGEAVNYGEVKWERLAG